MNEVIWALEQYTKDDDESQFYDHSAYENDNPKEWLDDLKNGVSKVKVDEEGLRAHQERKRNGFKLMGKYWMNFWD